MIISILYSHQSSLQEHSPHALASIPLLLRWYSRVQDVPGVRKAAERCGMTLFMPQPSPSGAVLPELATPAEELEPESAQPEKTPFVGGPRPTLTKLKVHNKTT